MEPRLYVIGDSISIHYGPALERNLKGICAYTRKGGLAGDLDNPDMKNANGGDSRRVLDYLTEAFATGAIKADYMLINAGLHDIKISADTREKQVDVKHYRESITRIIDLVRDAGITPIWVRTTPVIDEIHNTRAPFMRFNADVDIYNGIADSVMNEKDVPIIDLYAFTKQYGEAAYRDHVHFTESVCEEQGAYLAREITNIVTG